MTCVYMYFQVIGSTYKHRSLFVEISVKTYESACHIWVYMADNA